MANTSSSDTVKISDLSMFILYSTIFSLFSESFRVLAVIELKLFYFIILLNLILILISTKFQINKYHVLILMLLFIIGLFQTSSNIAPFLSQWLGISVISIFFYMFYTYFNKSVIFLFLIYAKFAFFIAIIGLLHILIVFLAKLYGINLGIDRLHSILTEPAHYATTLMPAMMYYFYHYKSHKIHFFVLLVSMLLTISILAYVGILLAIMFKFSEKLTITRFVTATITTIVLSISFYQFSSLVSMRVDDTVKALANEDLTRTNTSTYTLLSNYFVAKHNFKLNPFFGSGLGTHPQARDEHLMKIKGIESKEPFLRNLNAQDAASLFIRVMSEQGLFGLLLVGFFIIKFGVGLEQQYKIISRSILIYFILKLIREGHYFSPEMYFFVLGYYFCYQQSKCISRQPENIRSLTSENN